MDAFPSLLDPNNPMLRWMQSGATAPRTIDGGPLRIVPPSPPPAGATAAGLPMDASSATGKPVARLLNTGIGMPGGNAPAGQMLPSVPAPPPLDASATAPPGLAPTSQSLSQDATQSGLLRSQQDLQRLQQQGPGWQQIQSPVGRTLAGIGSGILDRVAPGIASIVPGTTGDNLRLQGLDVAHIGQDQGQLKAQAALGDSQAQAQQRQAMADQESAKAQELLNPKPSNGQLLYDKNGTPIGFQGPDGNYMGMHDPNLPSGVGDILGAAQRKQPTNAFELWQQQNPKGTADDYLKLSGEGKVKPLPQQLLEAEQSGDSDTANRILRVINQTQVQPKIDVHNATAPPSVPGIPATPGGHVDPMVQAIIDGRAPAPNIRSRQGIALMAAVTAADPTYDASRYNTYQRMQTEMTSGKTGQNINALNTLLNHVADARTHLPNNGSISLLNTIENAGSDAMGNNPTGKFDTDAVGIGGEFGKLVSGGVATVDEQKHVQGLLNHNASPKKLSENLDEIENLARGKLAGIQSQIQSAFHPGPGSYMPPSLPSPGGASGSGPATPASDMINVQIPGYAPSQIHASQRAAFLAKYPNAKVQ